MTSPGGGSHRATGLSHEAGDAAATVSAATIATREPALHRRARGAATNGGDPPTQDDAALRDLA